MDQRGDKDPTNDLQQTASAERPIFQGPTPTCHSPHLLSSAQTANTPSTTSANKVNALLAALAAHYAIFEDAATPRFFNQLCKDYNDGRSDEVGFYAAAYRLLVETNGRDLLPVLRELVPVAWRGADLWWLDGGIEGECLRRREIDSAGEGVEPEQDCGIGADAPVGSAFAGAVAIEEECTPSVREKKRKRTPVNRFRSSFRPRTPVGDAPLRSKVTVNANTQTPRQLHSDSLRSSPSTPLLAATTASLRLKKKTKPALCSPLRNSLRSDSPNPSTTTSTSTPTLSRSKAQKLLPSASQVSHEGPVYPTRRAILSRPATRPYIHALCGQRFGHPAEVQRHHNGQSGRPGCWEKSGKLQGDGGKWDADASCRVRLKDLGIERVQEGYVVVDRGRASWEDGEEKGYGVGTQRKRKGTAEVTTTCARDEADESEEGVEVGAGDGDDDDASEEVEGDA